MEVTQREKLPFTTHFARIAYAAHKYNLPRSLQYYVHQFRRLARSVSTSDEHAVENLGAKAVADLIFTIWQQPPGDEVAQVLPLDWPMPLQEVAVVDGMEVGQVGQINLVVVVLVILEV